MIPGESSPYLRHANDNGERTTALQVRGGYVGPPVTDNIGGTSPATFSTAPYIPPRSQRPGYCRAKNDTCKARPVRGTELCIFHSPGQARHDRIGVLEHEGSE